MTSSSLPKTNEISAFKTNPNINTSTTNFNAAKKKNPHKKPTKCKICKKPIKGRTDKIFCSVSCKNYYHIHLRKVTTKVVKDINSILHRNRSILLELMGKRKSQIKIQRLLLEKKNFHFKYHTHFHINSSGKTYYYVYDFAWMTFSDDEVLILRNKN